MVKTRPNKTPNKLFDTDYVHTRTSKKVSKKKKPKKPSRRVSPRGKRKLVPPSSDSGEDSSPSPPRKKSRKRGRHEPEPQSSKGLTIVFARKGRDMSISGKRGKKSSKSKSRHIEDPRSTSAAFKRKGMDRDSRPDSPTRGIEEVDRIKLAIDDVKSGEVSSVQKAAFKWRVHADKLYRRLKGSVRIDGRNGPPPVLSRAEEDKLTTWINTMSERGFPVSSGSLRNTVQNFLKQDKRDNPFTDDKPSMSWYKAFVRRNPKVKTVSSMMLTRSLKSTQAILEGWYMEFDNFLKSLDISDRPEKIWHFVAIDLSTATNQTSFASPNSPYDNGGREKVCTCIVSANAAGLVIPPFFVFRGHCAPSSWDPLVGAPLSSGCLFTQMGSSCKTMYSDWLENHFLPNVGSERPIALLLDCPEGHIDVDVFVTAQQNDVHLFRILPAIADIVSPIPEETLCNAWDKEAAAWNNSHPLVPVSIKNAARIVGKAWPKVDQPEAVIANFRRVGVYPVELGIVQELLTEKMRREIEMEDANRLSALKPAQSIISLELFESKLDKDKKEQFHRQLLAKDSGDETEEYRQWKQLYEEVYGKIIPVHDVPVAEEEVTVSYVEHVVDHPHLIETEIQQTDEVVTVEMKKEIDPSQVILSTDLSSVPRDVINVALTMATDIATYRTEGDVNHGANQVGSSIHVSGPDNTLIVESADMSCVDGVNISSEVHNGGEVASSEEVVTSPELSQSNGSTIISTIVPTKTSNAEIGLSMGGSPSTVKRKKTVVNVVPVPQKTGKHTVVNVIRVTPGEKRDVSHSNIAVHQTPISLAASGSKQSSSGFFHPVSADGSADSNSFGKEQILPFIHISDTGEVSVGPPEESRKEIVEVTEVVEVDSSQLSAGIPPDQIIQQFEVTGVEEVGGDEPKDSVVVEGDNSSVAADARPQGSEERVVVSGEVGLEGGEGEEEFVYHINIPGIETADSAASEEPSQGGEQMAGVEEGAAEETQNQTGDGTESETKVETVIENGFNQDGVPVGIISQPQDTTGQNISESTVTSDNPNTVSESVENIDLQEMNVEEQNIVIQVENVITDGDEAPIVIDSVVNSKESDNLQTLQTTEQNPDECTLNSEGGQSAVVCESAASTETSSAIQEMNVTEENLVVQVEHMASGGAVDPVVSDLMANSAAFSEASKVGNLMQGDIIMEGDVKADEGEPPVEVEPSVQEEATQIQIDTNMTEIMETEGSGSEVTQPEVAIDSTSETKAE